MLSSRSRSSPSSQLLGVRTLKVTLILKESDDNSCMALFSLPCITKLLNSALFKLMFVEMYFFLFSDSFPTSDTESVELSQQKIDF